MVRHKTRWLLVRFEFQRELQPSSNEKTEQPALTKTEIYKALTKCVVSSFGVASSGCSVDIQVRHFDETTRMAMIRVPRNDSAAVRASLTFLTSLVGEPVVASVISINGNARTAKVAAMTELRRRFREKKGSGNKKAIKKLQERLDVIQGIN